MAEITQRHLERLFELDYDHIEIEARPGWASVFVWRSFRRFDGFAEGAPTLDEALTVVVERVERHVAKEAVRGE